MKQAVQGRLLSTCLLASFDGALSLTSNGSLIFLSKSCRLHLQADKQPLNQFECTLSLENFALPQGTWELTESVLYADI